MSFTIVDRLSYRSCTICCRFYDGFHERYTDTWSRQGVCVRARACVKSSVSFQNFTDSCIYLCARADEGSKLDFCGRWPGRTDADQRQGCHHHDLVLPRRAGGLVQLLIDYTGIMKRNTRVSDKHFSETNEETRGVLSRLNARPSQHTTKGGGVQCVRPNCKKHLANKESTPRDIACWNRLCAKSSAKVMICNV